MREADYLPLVEMALREDLGDEGDVTSKATVTGGTSAATLWSKAEGVLAGEEVFAAVFRVIDPSVTVAFGLHDGASLGRGVSVARVQGPTASLLAGERTALNFLSFLSGIATATRGLVDMAAAAGHAVILDTRKTLPGYRALSKYAVTVGGGKNHRQGLYDMVLIKDNHIDASGSVTAAVRAVRSAWGRRFTVEVECRNPAEVDEALAAGADMIMLDNMGPDAMGSAVARIGGRVKVEASGNMGPGTIPAASAAGVDYISVGALTHSVSAFDFSLKIGQRSG